MNNWFQLEDVDIFVSHSHRDIQKVKAFAGWLYDEFGLMVFIDSCAWGYCDELLKQIDNEYCKKKDGKTYNYDLRNYTTSHVHIMLNTALMEMIDKTESIIFYNTPKSVSLATDLKKIESSKKKVTLSPWICSELSMISYIRRTLPKRKRTLHESVIAHSFSRGEDLSIEYNIDAQLDKTLLLDSNNLECWANKYSSQNISNGIHPLDCLYDMMKI